MLTPELYEAILLEHSKHPLGQGLLAEATHRSTLANAEVGDEVQLTLLLADSKIAAVGWEAKGSALLKASCSLMGQHIHGMTLAEAQSAAEQFRALLTGPEPTAEALASLGDVAALMGIRHLPARVECTMLPWRTLKSSRVIRA